jgi:hypothetical protein
MPKSYIERYAALPLDLRLWIWRGETPWPRVCETCTHWTKSDKACGLYGEIPDEIRETEDACTDHCTPPF